MRTATISRLACSVCAAALTALAACNGDDPTQPRAVMQTLSPPVALAAGSVTVTYCTSRAPIWAASQDGTGPWKRVNPTSANTFTFSFPSGKGGVATVSKSGTGFRLDVVFATVADFNSQIKSTNLGCPGTKSVKGSVAHVAAGQIASVALGTSSAFLFGGGPTTFTLTNVQDGPRDLIATRGNTSLQINSVILRRAINPANGATLGPLDFAVSPAFAPATAKATVSGLPTGAKASVGVLFFSPRGTGAALSGAANVGNTTVSYTAIPIAKLAAGEFQLLSANTAPTAATLRTSGVWIRTIANRTLAFGPALPAATVSTAGATPYYRPRLRVTSQAQYNKGISVTYGQATINRTATVFATASYFGAAAPVTWDVSIPDLHAVAGFLTTWAQKTGQATKWNLQAFGGTLPFFSTSPTDGSLFRSASNTGSLTAH